MLRASSLAVAMLARSAQRVRREPGEYVDGRWLPGEETMLAIRAVVQPASSHDLLRLPEGERVEGMVAFWSKTDLRTASVNDGTDADRVIADGTTYEVVRVMERPEGGWVKVLASRTDE